MAKVQIVDTIKVYDSTERTVTIKLTQEQMYDAFFTWMRLNNVKLPSQEPSDYNITYNINVLGNSNYSDSVILIWRKTES